MAEIISQPPIRESLNEEDAQGVAIRPTRAWTAWFQQAYRVMFASTQSGTTAQRPTANLYPGRPYFDTSLGANGKPIWIDKTGGAWVDAAGNTV